MMKHLKNPSLYKAGFTTKHFCVTLSVFLLFTAFTHLGGATPLDAGVQQTQTFNLSPPTLEKDGEFSTIQLQGTSLFEEPGLPILPIITTVFYLPIHTLDISVSFELVTRQTETQDIEGTLRPGSSLLPLVFERFTKLIDLFSSHRPFRSIETIKNNVASVVSLDDEVYGKGIFYPQQQLHYKVGIGLHNGVLSKIVSVSYFPVQYDGVKTISYSSGEITLKVTYHTTGSLPLDDPEEPVDLLIISADAYVADLQLLLQHKEDHGITTKLVTLSEITCGTFFDVPDWCADIQEQIKYFLFQAVQEWDVQYVMAVGGFRTVLGLKIPKYQFPVRYSHLELHEPGYVTDQYYSCLFRDDGEGGIAFDSWDSNGNGRFAEYDFQGFDYIDPFVDVYFGRLACRNRQEVRTIIKKIITYETETFDAEWSSKMLTVTGDGFQDQDDLNVAFNTAGFPDGDYTLFAQSALVSDPTIVGPIDTVRFTIDKTASSRVTYDESDHEKIKSIDAEQESLYPALPVAEITSIANDNILGNTDISFVPPEAYDGGAWTPVSYKDGVLMIRGKSYDPRPHEFEWSPPSYPTRPIDTDGSLTTISIWINNSDGERVAGPVVVESQMVWEGEAECEVGIQYMAEYESTRLWTSNGLFTGMWDVIDEFSKGYGFVYFAGHSSCMGWGDHYPGIPGTRVNGQINGIAAINMRFGLARYAKDEGEPLFPIDHLTNGNKLPIVVMGGCHSAQFDTGLMRLLTDPYNVLFGDAYGTWIPEGMGWWMTRTPQGGGIAFLGFAGLGFGRKGLANVNGLSGWMNGEVFRLIGDENYDILGAVYGDASNGYSSSFDTLIGLGHRKTFEEFTLLGDPTLKIGGYPPETALEEVKSLDDSVDNTCIQLDLPMEATIQSFEGGGPLSGTYDVLPEDIVASSPVLISNGSASRFMTGFSHETMQFGEPELDPGFAISTGGAEWQTFSKGWAGNQEHVTIDNRGYSAHGAFASFGNQGSNVYVIVMGDIMESTTWESIHWGEWILHNVGKGGTALVSGYPQETVWSEGHWIFGMITDVDYEGYKTQVPAFFWPKTDAYGSGTVSWYPGLTNAGQITGCVDTVTSYAHFACKRGTGGYSFSDPVETFPPSSATSISGQFAHPDIIAHNSKAYLVYEYGDAIRCRRSLNNGASWQTYIVDSSGMQPKVVINEDETIVCYYIRDGEIIESISEDFGVTWSEVRTLAVPSIDVTTETPFDVTSDALVYATLDGGLKSLLLKETKSAMIHGITVDKNKVITTLVTNAGSTYLHNAQVRIFVEGVSPLGQYFGGGPLLIALFKGRVLGAAETIENMSLSPKENFEVTATAFGLGHVLITVQVIDDEEILAEKQEDGFLFGGRVLLFHEEE